VVRDFWNPNASAVVGLEPVACGRQAGEKPAGALISTAKEQKSRRAQRLQGLMSLDTPYPTLKYLPQMADETSQRAAISFVAN